MGGGGAQQLQPQSSRLSGTSFVLFISLVVLCFSFQSNRGLRHRLGLGDLLLGLLGLLLLLRHGNRHRSVRDTADLHELRDLGLHLVAPESAGGEAKALLEAGADLPRRDRGCGAADQVANALLNNNNIITYKNIIIIVEYSVIR